MAMEMWIVGYRLYKTVAVSFVYLEIEEEEEEEEEVCFDEIL